MKAPELFARNYLIFRYPTEYILLMFPMIIGVFVNVFFPAINLSNFVPQNEVVEEFRIELMEDQKLLAIDNYILAVKFTSIVILAFFICYRWSNMQNNGGYGFWLTLGLNKQRFFVETLAKTFILFVLGHILGLILIYYLNQFQVQSLPDVFLIIKIVLMMMSHTFVLIAIALLLANLIQNPEISALLYIILTVVNVIFNKDSDSPLHQLLQSDLQYRTETVWFSLILSTALGVALNFATLRLHLTFDIDL